MIGFAAKAHEDESLENVDRHATRKRMGIDDHEYREHAVFVSIAME